MDPPFLPEPIVGPRVAEMICHVETKMFAHLGPPTCDRKDTHPWYDEVESEFSPCAVEVDGRKDSEPVKELGGIRCGSHPELRKGGDYVLVLEPASERETVHEPVEPTSIEGLL